MSSCGIDQPVSLGGGALLPDGLPPPPPLLAGAGEPPPPGPMALQIPPEFGGQPLVTPELLAHAHAHGVQVHVWTVNDTDEMERLLDLGVDAIMSDFPGRLRDVIRRRR